MHYICTKTVKIRILLFFIFLVSTTVVAQAGPLTFSNVRILQDEGFTSIDLFNNSGITVNGTQLVFLIDVDGTLPPGGTDTLVITYHDSLGGVASQTVDIPVLGFGNPPFTSLLSINVPIFSYVAIPTTLTVDLLNSNPDFINPTTQAAVNSFTYSFNVAQPVPEPATLAFFAGAASTLVFKYRKNRKNKKSRAD